MTTSQTTALESHKNNKTRYGPTLKKIKFVSYEPKALWLVEELIRVYRKQGETFTIKEIVHNTNSGKMLLVDDQNNYYGVLENKEEGKENDGDTILVRLSAERARQELRRFYPFRL